MQKLEQKYICNNSIIIKTPRTCEMCQKLMESSNAGSKKNHRDHQKTKYKKKKNKSMVKNADSKKTKEAKKSKSKKKSSSSK